MNSCSSSFKLAAEAFATAWYPLSAAIPAATLPSDLAISPSAVSALPSTPFAPVIEPVLATVIVVPVPMVAVSPPSLIPIEI